MLNYMMLFLEVSTSFCSWLMHFFNRWWRDLCNLLSTPTATFKSFELSAVTTKLPHSHLALYSIYQPPQFTTKFWHSVFLPVSRRLSDSQLICFNFSWVIYHRRLNIHVDDFTDSNAIQFLSLLDHANLTQHISYHTHRHFHALNRIITSGNFTISPTIISLPISPTDYFPIICSLKSTNSPTAP